MDSTILGRVAYCKSVLSMYLFVRYTALAFLAGVNLRYGSLLLLFFTTVLVILGLLNPDMFLDQLISFLQKAIDQPGGDRHPDDTDSLVHVHGISMYMVYTLWLQCS